MAKLRDDGRRGRDDAALWQDAVRSVNPLPRRQLPALSGRGVAAADNGAPRRGEPSALDRSAGIDGATSQRLKRGLRPIEARLDLHGMSQAEAHRALGEFVRAASAAGHRSLLVITGRGTDRPSVLRSSVPRWLDAGELRRQILAVAAARPRHGGGGALYVLLRRRRR
jgi:DNA-nicking Smr family endonuclease